MEKPPLSNDDITQLLVETADSTVIQSDSKPAKMNNVVPENNQIVIDKLVNTNETDKMDSIEGFMKHIHGQSKSSEEIVKITQSSDVLAKGPEKIVDENIPSTSKDVSCNSTKINNKLNEKSDVSKGHVKTNGTKPKSAPILLPSPIFEDAITPFERKPYRIPKISQSINTVKVTTEPLPQIKRRISTQSSKAEEPSQKKLRSMSSVDNVKQPVEKTNIKTKKASNKNKKDESLKTFVEKLPVSITDVPQTSELILSLENLVGKEGIKKMKSIFIDSTDDTNKVSTVKESLKRPEEKSNLKTNSAKKKKLIEQICNDEVVISEKKSVVIRKKSPKKKNELDRLNEDIDRMFIRDSVLNATGKRVCTMKPTVEEIEKIELAKQMKSCRLILHKLQFNIEDMPVNINELQLLNINSIYLAKSSLTPVSSKVTVKSKPKIKSKIMLNKLKGRYTRLSSKQLIIKDEEWEDVDDDQDDKDENAVSSSNVKIEQIVTDEAMISEKNTSIIEIVENLKNCVEKVHTENLKLSPSVIVKTSEDTVSSSIELQSSNKNLVDITINSKSKPFIIPFKSVFNLSYAMIPSGTVYKCMCNDCKYQTTVKPSFVSHLNDNHMSYNWHGFCNICKKFVENVNDRSETNLIINEFNHMLECHILIEQTSVVEHSQNAGNSKNSLAFVNSPNFMPKITHNNSNNHIVSNTAGTNTGVNIVGKLIPMVKVSMNRLMAPIQQKEILKSTLTKPQPVASTVVKTPASTSWTQTVLNTTPKAQSTPSPLANNITYLNHDNMPNDILRPWLSEQISSKSHEVCKEMLTDICLTAFYKCMATTCSYYTDDVVLFTTHLKAHLQFQLSDKINFTKCSYCTFRGSGIESLIAHIKCLHKYDRFSCFHCFYRTVVDFNVLTHMELFHKMKPKMVLECNRPQSKNYCIELETIKKTRSSFVPPIICVCKYYISWSKSISKL